MIGIMLMGLVTKNGILLVDFANQREEGMGRREALLSAGRTRLRAIIMTTVAMIFGMLPLAIALGEGAEQRAPMGRAVIGGLITSTLLTLFVVPVVYTLLDDSTNRLFRRGAEPAQRDAPVTAPRRGAHRSGLRTTGLRQRRRRGNESGAVSEGAAPLLCQIREPFYATRLPGW